MGTNYYWYSGPYQDKRHIGKSSAGWCFSLHVYPDTDLDVTSLEDWKELFAIPESKIFDEYGCEVLVEEMVKTIAGRSWERPCGWTAEEFASNRAVPGPGNLVRYEIDGNFCIGHGEGTWDLIQKDFS